LVLRHGQNPYTTDLLPIAKQLGLEKGYILHANDPPTFLITFEPLTLLSVHRAYWAWQAINLAAFAMSLILLFAPRYSGLSRPTALSLAALAILYPPVGNNLALAQSKLILLFLLAAMIRCMERGRDAVAGLMLAAASLLRLFPLLLVLYLLLRRRWRMLAYTIAGITIGALLTVVVAGVSITQGFFASISLLTSQTWLSSNSNISLEAFVSRTFWDLLGNSGGQLDLVRRICVRVADIVVLYFVVKATPLDSTQDQDWRVLSLWIVASVMLSPTAWFHYLLLMLIAVAQIASAARRGRISDRALWMAIGSYLMTGAVGIVLGIAAPDSKLFDVTRQFEFLCLLMFFVAAYWFALDTGVITDSQSSDVPAEVM
jgi:hypothetical protein